MDMSNAYGKWVRENLPGVPVIYDHFHVIKAMNDHINSIRRKAMARISADVRRCIRELDVEKMAKTIDFMASASRIVARVVNGLVNGGVNGLSTRQTGREGASCHLAKPP